MSRKGKRRVKQSRRKVEQPPTPPAVKVEKPRVAYVSDRSFFDVEDCEVGYADERQLRLLMKDWRKGRATRTIWDMLTDYYVALFSLIVILAMIISGLLSAQKSAAGCTDAGCQTAQNYLPWLTLLVVALATLALSRLFGPVIASAAEGFWLLDAPVRRSKFLTGRLWAVLALSAVSGVVVSAVVSMLSGVEVKTAVAWAIATGLIGVAMTAIAAVCQATENITIFRIVQLIVGVSSIVIAGLMIVASRGIVTGDPHTSLPIALMVLGIAAGVCVLFSIVAQRLLTRLRRTRLVSGGDLVSGMQGAMFALDFGLMRDIVVGRRWMEKGQVTSREGRGVGVSALVWRDVQRLTRSPKNLVVLAASVIVPYAMLSMGLGNITVPLGAIVLMFCLVPFFDSLRVMSRTKGLARTLPLSTSEINSALTTVPGILVAVWAILAAPAFVLMTTGSIGSAIVKAAITGIAAFVGAIRWVSAKSADYSSPMVATGFGAMPPGLMFNLIRGFDVIALTTLPLLVGWSPWISVIIALICYLVLRSGGIDTQDMMERQEEARKELEEMKRGNTEKIHYQRNARR